MKLHCQKLKSPYILHNSRLTARGLVDVLEQAPDDIHLIEDAETLFLDKKAPGVLKSALHSQSKTKPPVREITWTAFKTFKRFVFSGHLIVISNRDLAQEDPDIRAIKTRINVLRNDVTNNELLALMKKICLAGYKYGEDYVTPEQCWMVAQYIRLRLTELKRSLDLRLLINAFKDYLQFRNNASAGVHWMDLVEGRMRETVIEVVKRKDKMAEEIRIALDINKLGLGKKEMLAEWKKRTGHDASDSAAERSYYRRLKDAQK